MTNMKVLATVLGASVALTLIELQPSVAQPGSGFENRGERYSEGDYYRRTGRNPTSVSASRQQAVETCSAQARSQSPGSSRGAQRQRGFLYASCMNSKGQRP
jgi:hypothetical protein